MSIAKNMFMKKYLFILLACVFTATVVNGQTKKKVSSSGDSYTLTDFRDILWGSHIDSVVVDGQKVKFTKSTEFGDKNAYKIDGDDLMIGTVVLKNLYYIFNSNDRFIGVIMMGDSKQLGEMKYILVTKFGQPQKEENPVSGRQYYWTIDDVRISLVNESINQLFTVDFTSDYEMSESKRINRNVDDF